VTFLNLIEEKTVRRVGSVCDTAVDVRIIAATHQPLEERIREGRFRPDLFYRLRGVQLRVPALRMRGADVLRIAQHFLEQQAKRYARPNLAFDHGAERALMAHPWPGNVRELRNIVEEAVLLALPMVPRKPGLEEPQDDPKAAPGTPAAPKESPFAALERLRKKPE